MFCTGAAFSKKEKTQILIFLENDWKNSGI